MFREYIHIRCFEHFQVIAGMTLTSLPPSYSCTKRIEDLSKVLIPHIHRNPFL